MSHTFLIVPIARNMYERRVTIVFVGYRQISYTKDIDYYI
jgi:hypothetical protein